MLVDSHCHLNFPELKAILPEVLSEMESHDVTHALCICVTLAELPEVLAITESHAHIYASVGVHPDSEIPAEPSADDLVVLAQHNKVVAIGETGLDYFRLTGDLEWQRERFRQHIRAARICRKPLVIHTRSASKDTLRIMAEEGAEQVGGVMHCFTESWEVAEAALAMNFFISFSGIVTFKNARELKAVAQRVPLDRILIETDSPYLAPVPHRGKTNQPAYVRFVADEIARLRGVAFDEIASVTSANFFRLFNVGVAAS